MASCVSCLCLFVTIFCTIIEAQDTTEGENTIFENPLTGLVLDGTEHNVKAKKRNENSVAQSWLLEHINSGKFVIRNKKTKKVLDIENGPARGNKIVTADRDYSKGSQQWYINSGGSIINADDQRLALQVNADNKVGAQTKRRESQSQKFKLTYYQIVQ